MLGLQMIIRVIWNNMHIHKMQLDVYYRNIRILSNNAMVMGYESNLSQQDGDMSQKDWQTENNSQELSVRNAQVR